MRFTAGNFDSSHSCSRYHYFTAAAVAQRNISHGAMYENAPRSTRQTHKMPNSQQRRENRRNTQLLPLHAVHTGRHGVRDVCVGSYPQHANSRCYNTNPSSRHKRSTGGTLHLCSTLRNLTPTLLLLVQRAGLLQERLPGGSLSSNDGEALDLKRKRR